MKSKAAFNMAKTYRPHKKRGISAAPLWACIVHYASIDFSAACDFAKGMAEITSVHQCNMLKDWIMKQDQFAGGQKQREFVRRALFCMKAHYENKKPSRIGLCEPIELKEGNT